MSSWQTLELIARTDGALRARRGETLYAITRTRRRIQFSRLWTAVARRFAGSLEPTSKGGTVPACPCSVAQTVARNR